MSLNADSATEDAASTHKPKIILKTGEQYYLWKERVSTVCWTLTRLDVFALTDANCEELIKIYDERKSEKDKAKQDLPLAARVDVVGKSWDILTSYLSDELFMKVSHVQKGKIASLISEIKASLAVMTIEDIQPLRVDLYGATMVKNCDSDLQSYISYITSRKEKLAFLKTPVPEEELILIFLKGLSPVFNPIQVHFAIPGTLPKKFDEVVAVVRKFSTNPTVAAELAKDKTAAAATVLVASVSLAQKPANKPYCNNYTKNGRCHFGSRCKFSHGISTSTPQQTRTRETAARTVPTCYYCRKGTHTV